MTRKLIFTTAGLALLLGGCASHYALVAPIARMERTGLINDPKQVSRLEKAMTDGDIARLLDLDVRAKLPTSLAVAKLASHCSGYQPRLERIGADELAAWEKIVAARPHLHGVQPVSNLSLDGTLRAQTVTLHSLRVAAAKLHCELLMVYMQADSSVDNFNDAAALYWTVVGLWLAPGNVVEHRTVMQAIVVDCRTGVILGTATGDGHKERITPAAFVKIQQDKLARQVPGEALADLQKGAGRLLTAVVGRATERDDRPRRN